MTRGDIGSPRPRLRRPQLLTAGLFAAFAILAVVVVMSVATGSRTIRPGAVWEALSAFEPGNEEHIIVRSLRAPRTVLGLLVGAALGLAGSLMQGIARNPLADPGILGVNAGAALFVVVAIHVFGISSPLGYVWFALAGAALAAVVVYLLGSAGTGGATPLKLTLAGAAFGALALSLTTTILLLDAAALDRFRFWAVGSLQGRPATAVVQLAGFFVVGAIMAFAARPLMNVLALGDDVAGSLGARVARGRIFAAASVVLLAGAATAAAGPIAFVGLTIPHVARAITGPDYRWILPYAAVLAPTLLLGADVLGRVVVRPAELQVGIVTALVGGPFFVALVRRRQLAHL